MYHWKQELNFEERAIVSSSCRPAVCGQICAEGSSILVCTGHLLLMSLYLDLVVF